MKIENPPQTCFIRKEGIITWNPGAFSKWKDNYIVITTEGFMHVFNTSEDKEPSNTLNLKWSRVQEKKETKFEVIETKKGIFGTKKNAVMFRTKTLGDMQDWIKAIQDSV